MPVIIPAAPVASQAQVDANAFLAQSADFLTEDIAEVRAAWWRFWDINQSTAYLQAKVDYLAGLPGTDQSGATNAFMILCAVALRRIAYCVSETPDCMADAKLEHTGALQPNGQPYRQFTTAGWYWTIDATKPSGMAFSSPVIWTP